MYVPLHSHPDYAHVASPELTGQPFALDAGLLARLRTSNGFDTPLAGVTPSAPVVLALRGASLEGVWRWRRNGRRGMRPSGVQTGTPILVTDHIDHERPRCVIAVWATDGTLMAFQGSTVAHVDWLKAQWTASRRRPVKRVACTLATGRYRYTVGTHRGRDGDIPHALTQHDKLPVYRSHIQGASPSRTLLNGSQWHAAHTNLHAGRTDAGEQLDTFSSAGCLTVPGKVGLEPWLTFVARASGSDGAMREVIVLTGAEALAAADQTTPLPRLARPGSSVERVKALQTRLGLTVDGDFGAKTFKAWVRHGPLVD